jgi:hypothetical protein
MPTVSVAVCPRTRELLEIDIEKLLFDIQGFWDGGLPIAAAGMLVVSPTSAAAAIVRTVAPHNRLRT